MQKSTRNQKAVFSQKNYLKAFLTVTRIITNMLYYTENPTDLIESPRTISIYLEQLPWAFVFFPKNAIKFTSSKQQNILSLSFQTLLTGQTQSSETQDQPQKAISCPYLYNWLKYPTKRASGMKKQKYLQKYNSDVLDQTGSRCQLLYYVIFTSS